VIRTNLGIPAAIKTKADNKSSACHRFGKQLLDTLNGASNTAVYLEPLPRYAFTLCHRETPFSLEIKRLVAAIVLNRP